MAGKGIVNEREVIRGREIDFLGYNFSRENVRLRKGIKKRFAKKMHSGNNELKKMQAKASYWGWCKWGNCRHLWRVITNNDMSFAEKGIHPENTTKDGKKFFDVQDTRITDILNTKIKVIDFEAGIKTKQGPDRYCVLFEDEDGQRRKFITNAYNIKTVLDASRKAEAKGQKIFPVDNVVVKRKSLGDGKCTYYFD